MRSEVRRRLARRNAFDPGSTKDMIQVGDLTPTETNLLFSPLKNVEIFSTEIKESIKKKVMDKKCRRILMFPKENLN